MNEVLAYMYLTLKKSDEKNHSIRRKAFKKQEKTIKLVEGASDFFEEMNSYAKNRGVIIQHYIISSWLKEILEGTSIAKKFNIFLHQNFFMM